MGSMLLARVCVRHMIESSSSSRLLETRYGADAAPKEVIKKLLGCHASDDWDSESSTAVTGEQGGRILSCFLLSVRDSGSADVAFIANAGGVVPWLQAQLPKYANLYPVQKSCIEHAIKFFPKLESELNKAQRAAPPPDFGSDDDDAAAPPEPDF